MKYILRESGKDELFDLKVDPTEKNDILLKLPKVAKNMKMMAVKYREKRISNQEFRFSNRSRIV